MDNFGDPGPSLIKDGSTIHRGSNDSSNSSSSSSIVNGSNYAISGKAMLCSVIVLFAALVLILGFHTYARRLFWCHRRRRRGLLPLHHAGTAESQKCGGLEVSVIKSLPTFTFNADSGDNLGDCPVCLSEFEDGESGRALPKCGHAFHVECIDMWFYNHSNCPLCRAPVQARLDSSSSTTIPNDVSLTGQENENHVNAGVNDISLDAVVITVEAPLPTEERFRGLQEAVDSGPDEGDRDKSQPNRFCL